MKTTLLIATYNWKEALNLCLSSLLKQTVIPSEVVIADDGSREDTKALIDTFRGKLPIPLIHVWQEDKGFRKTLILNKAVAQAHGDYIIQVDGDVFMERHFIQDHLELAERGYYVCGSRVKVEKNVTEKLIQGTNRNMRLSDFKFTFILNSFRSHLLRSFLAKRYARKIDHMRGCNFAFWKDDFMAVNGYNEDLLEWGHEDGELVFRLHFSGVNKKALKMGGIVYHLWHKESSRHNEKTHLNALEYVKKNRISRCTNGIDKYLTTSKTKKNEEI